MSNFLRIITAFGYKIFIEKGKDRITLQEEHKKSKKKGISFIAAAWTKWDVESSEESCFYQYVS